MEFLRDAQHNWWQITGGAGSTDALIAAKFKLYCCHSLLASTLTFKNDFDNALISPVTANFFYRLGKIGQVCITKGEFPIQNRSLHII